MHRMQEQEEMVSFYGVLLLYRERRHHLKKIDWKVIRYHYERREKSVHALIKEYGITPNQLYRHVQSEGWQYRRGPGRIPKRVTKHVPECNGGKEKSGKVNKATKVNKIGKPKKRQRITGHSRSRKMLLQRMFSAVEKQIHDIEERLETMDSTSMAEPGNVRALNALASTLDKLMRIDKSMMGSDNNDGRDIPALRATLAQRIDRLRGKLENE